MEPEGKVLLVKYIHIWENIIKMGLQYKEWGDVD
jgi:hypothetical protein